MSSYPRLSEPATFEVTSGAFLVSDPCYSDGDLVLKFIKNGKWNAGVLHTNEGDWGIRVGELIAVHSDYKFESPISGVPTLAWEEEGYVGVDSGQMSIMDNMTYFERVGHEDWYEAICDTTCKTPQWGVLPTGVVSSSGYGDGGYRVYAARNDAKEVIAVAVVFISDDEIDEYDPDNDELLPRPDIDLEEEELD